MPDTAPGSATLTLARNVIVRVGRVDVGSPAHSATARRWVQELVERLGFAWHGFEDTPRGAKPSLRDSPVDATISHSRDWVAVAATPRGRVGIDVQYPEAVFDERALVRRMCTPLEREQVARMLRTDRRRSLSRTWAAKEAYAKALGVGLALGFDDVEAAAIEHRPETRAAWASVLPDGTALAIAWLAAEHRARDIRCRHPNPSSTVESDAQAVAG